MCKSILSFLRETLERMVKSLSWMKSLKFNFCIRCPICLGSTVCEKHRVKDASQGSGDEASDGPSISHQTVPQYCYRDSCIHLIPEKDLLMRKPRCEKSPTKHNVISANEFSHWFSTLRNQCEHDEDYDKETPQASSSSNKEVIVGPLCLTTSTPLIPMEKATELAKEIAKIYGLTNFSVQDPPEESRRHCREKCKELRTLRQVNLLEELRNELPYGMTGPCRYDYNTLVKNMPRQAKQKLTRALTGHKEGWTWKVFAEEQVNLHNHQVQFFATKHNPVFEILNEYCGDWNVERLYNALSDCGGGEIADCYL